MIPMMGSDMISYEVEKKLIKGNGFRIPLKPLGE